MVKIAVISDLHIGEGGNLDGRLSNARSIIQYYRDTEGVDIFIFGGDSLAQNSIINPGYSWPPPYSDSDTPVLVTSYAQSFRDMIDTEIVSYGKEVYAIPGNHDTPSAVYEKIMGDIGRTPKLVDKGDWAIVLLDSNGPKHGSIFHGVMTPWIGAYQRRWLLNQKDILNAKRAILVVTHAWLMDMVSVWSLGTKNPDATLITRKNSYGEDVFDGNLGYNVAMDGDIVMQHLDELTPPVVVVTGHCWPPSDGYQQYGDNVYHLYKRHGYNPGSATSEGPHYLLNVDTSTGTLQVDIVDFGSSLTSPTKSTILTITI